MRSLTDCMLSRYDQPRKPPVVLSPEEVARLLDAAPGLQYKAALSVAYGAGLRAAVSLKVSDIDGKHMLTRVEQGKGRKDRNMMLDIDTQNLRSESRCWQRSIAASDFHETTWLRLRRRLKSGASPNAHSSPQSSRMLAFALLHKFIRGMSDRLHAIRRIRE